MDLARILSFLVILVCAFIALNNQREIAALRSRSALEDSPHSDGGEEERLLTYDFYASSCPSTEKIVRRTVRELHSLNGSVGPALLRLAFHDCFIHGCDASVLLDSEIGIKSEKEKIPNLSLKGFAEIDAIKSIVEHSCPVTVSCADILAFAAARESGGHSTGKIHCNFILHRLFNFTGNNQPDPSLNSEFLEVLRSQCSHPPSSPSQSPSPSPPSSFENRAMKMDYEGASNGFGEVYYRSLMQGKGLLVVDQQLMARGDTKSWVERMLRTIYSFAETLGLLCSSLHIPKVLDGGGEVRLNCRKTN